jgi:hypothetical protein
VLDAPCRTAPSHGAPDSGLHRTLGLLYTRFEPCHISQKWGERASELPQERSGSHWRDLPTVGPLTRMRHGRSSLDGDQP